MFRLLGHHQVHQITLLRLCLWCNTPDDSQETETYITEYSITVFLYFYLRTIVFKLLPDYLNLLESYKRFIFVHIS